MVGANNSSMHIKTGKGREREEGGSERREGGRGGREGEEC